MSSLLCTSLGRWLLSQSSSWVHRMTPLGQSGVCWSFWDQLTLFLLHWGGSQGWGSQEAQHLIRVWRGVRSEVDDLPWQRLCGVVVKDIDPGIQLATFKILALPFTCCAIVDKCPKLLYFTFPIHKVGIIILLMGLWVLRTDLAYGNLL